MIIRKIMDHKDNSVNLAHYNSTFGLKNKIGRLIWKFCYWIFFRPFDLNFFKTWRGLVLRAFGAKVGQHANIYASVKIWAPWNLEIGEYSCLGPGVDCYNQGKIVIGKHSIVSQKTYLCASTHDFEIANFPLVCKPITIEDQVWVAADAFIGPGVRLKTGAVVGARAAVFKNVEAWNVVGGNPSKYIKHRNIKDVEISKPNSHKENTKDLERLIS